jgi:hypothetical protein
MATKIRGFTVLYFKNCFQLPLSPGNIPPIIIMDFRFSSQAMGVPCFLGGMSRGMLGRNSPLHIRQQRRDALKEADLVILAGKGPSKNVNVHHNPNNV